MLIDLIDLIREDDVHEGTWVLDGERQRDHTVPPLTIGLARFQSYRRRTTAALIQELEDYIEEAGLTQLHFKVLDEDSTVEIW